MTGVAMASGVTMRPLTAADQAWLRDYLLAQWGSPIMVIRETVYEIATLPGLVAETAERQVGLLTYRVDGETCEIMTLDCVERQRGVGSALVARMREEARARGCRRVTLVTTNDNVDALRFYQRRGFRLEALRPGAVDRGRRLKPEIPLIGEYGIPIRDEIQLTLSLDADNDDDAARPPTTEGRIP